jgi:1-acyl-sn-glycerol-3-phosphate acyltransferase
VKLIGPFLRVLAQLPVRRGEADAALVLKEGERALADGECVVIYPEGTATRDPAGWPMVARTGLARLALAIGDRNHGSHHALLGELRGEQPPAVRYDPAAARAQTAGDEVPPT